VIIMEKLSAPRHLYLCCHETPVFKVATSFNFLRFTATLEAHRDRPLCGLPVRKGAALATAWIAGEYADWLVYQYCRSPARSIQLLLHQAAHMMLGHTGFGLGGPDLAALLFPGLDAALARRIPAGVELSCGVATGEEEHEATALARDIALPGWLPGRHVSSPGPASRRRELPCRGWSVPLTPGTRPVAPPRLSPTPRCCGPSLRHRSPGTSRPPG
jgi:hypothetical protein